MGVTFSYVHGASGPRQSPVKAGVQAAARKREQTNLRHSRRKEIVKIRTEINEIETKEPDRMVNEKIEFFLFFLRNKTGILLTRLNEYSN